MYLDVGTAEGRQQGSPDEDTAVSRRYVEHVRQVHRALVAGGYSEGDALRYVEEPGGIHHESAWARRLPDALRFLLKDRV
jgi:predicted alpha/beta superfamily hydrolase